MSSNIRSYTDNGHTGAAFKFVSIITLIFTLNLICTVKNGNTLSISMILRTKSGICWDITLTTNSFYRLVIIERGTTTNRVSNKKLNSIIILYISWRCDFLIEFIRNRIP